MSRDNLLYAGKKNPTNETLLLEIITLWILCLNHHLESVIGKHDLDLKNCLQDLLRESKEEEKTLVFGGLLNYLNIIFHVNTNVGTKTGKRISRTTCLLFGFHFKPVLFIHSQIPTSKAIFCKSVVSKWLILSLVDLCAEL